MMRPVLRVVLFPALALLVVSLALLWPRASSIHAAKPVPTVTSAEATLVNPAPCQVRVDVEWVDVKGPGGATLQLVGDPNATSISFRANAGGVTATLFPVVDTELTQVQVVIEKKNGRELLNQTVALEASVTCPP